MSPCALAPTKSSGITQQYIPLISIPVMTDIPYSAMSLDHIAAAEVRPLIYQLQYSYYVSS